jgi:hypothetical protein
VLTVAPGWRCWVVRWVSSSRGIGSAVEEARWWCKWRCSCMHEAFVALVASHVGPSPRAVGEDLGACWRRLSPRRLGTQVGRVAFKRRVTLLEGDHVFALPYASCPSTFQAPGWGIPAVFPLRCWRNATPRELVPFSHRSASRIFIMQPGCTPPPAVTQDGDLQFDGGGKQTGPRPLPLPQPQGFSSLGLGRGVCRVGVGPCVGGGPLLPSVIGGKGGCCP